MNHVKSHLKKVTQHISNADYIDDFLPVCIEYTYKIK